MGNKFKDILPTHNKLLDDDYRQRFVVIIISALLFLASMVFMGLDFARYQTMSAAMDEARSVVLTRAWVELGFGFVCIILLFVTALASEMSNVYKVSLSILCGGIMLYFLIVGDVENENNVNIYLCWLMIFPFASYMIYDKIKGSIVNSIMLAALIVLLWVEPVRNVAVQWNVPETFFVRFPLVFIGGTVIGLAYSVIFDAMRKENKRLIDKYSLSSRTDFLTQLHNRYWLSKYIDKQKNNLKPYDVVNVMYIDIDNFKNFNDKYGHAFGDEVLKFVSDVLINRAVENVIRMGGDEFLILFENKSQSDLRNLGEKIRIDIDEHKFKENPEAHVTVSVGISSQRVNNSLDYNELINLADSQTAKAKARGKNRVYVLGENDPNSSIDLDELK